MSAHAYVEAERLACFVTGFRNAAKLAAVPRTFVDMGISYFVHFFVAASVHVEYCIDYRSIANQHEWIIIFEAGQAYFPLGYLQIRMSAVPPTSFRQTQTLLVSKRGAFKKENLLWVTLYIHLKKETLVTNTLSD